MSDRGDDYGQQWLAEAARATLERIRTDQDNADTELVRTILQHIETHLFTKRLNVNRLKKDLGIRDR